MEAYEPKFISAVPVNITYRADGLCESEISVTHTDNVSEDEVRQTVAHVYGMDPEEVKLGQTSRETARRRGSVAFTGSKWNASWDPKADPTMN